MHRIFNRLPTFFIVALFVLISVVAQPGRAQSPEQIGRQAVEAVAPELDQIEAILNRAASAEALSALRQRLDPLRDRLAAALAEIEPRLADARERISQLVARPAEGAPPESAEAKAQREALAKEVSEIDTRVRALRVLMVKGDQISDRITDKRRQLFTAQLLERAPSVVDPRFWTDLVNAIPRVTRTSQVLLDDWTRHLFVTVGASNIFAAIGVGLLAAALMFFGYRALLRRGLYGSPQDIPTSDLAKVLADLRVAAERALVLPAIVGVAVAIVKVFELAPLRAAGLLTAIMTATFVVSVTRGVMQGVLAPGAPAYRLVPIADRTAEIMYDSARQAAWVIAFGVVLLAVAAIIFAPVAVTQLITAGSAVLLALIAFGFLRATRPSEEETEAAEVTADPGKPATYALGWIRPALWILVAAIFVALLGGYIALGALIASRVAAAIVIAGATVLILRLLDALVANTFGAETPRGRALSLSIGIQPRRLELIGTLTAGLARLVILLLSFAALVGPWNFGGVGAALDDSMIGFRFGDVSSIVGAVIGAAFVVAIGFFALRALQRWLRDKVLPQTGMDAGLQNSVATILGYAGIAAVIGLGLRQLGLDLSNLTIVAGALSVGIGFGLQSIVSNFVSGLILLAERPIRVGDSIVVKGEEGHVKKISVRSTEIETFERATVIVPNADLISGVVKNWTHSNTQGRIVVPVRVAYDSTADAVRSELLEAALEQSEIVKSPLPRVFLIKFGDNGLEFELRCIVRDIDKALSVKSELQLSILRRFQEKGIVIAPPRQRVQKVEEAEEQSPAPKDDAR